MKKYKYVFIILVYRNTIDLKEFFESLKLPESKVIVVNSFFDEASDKEFKRIAQFNNADYITVPNKGYGAGNNRGCEYAIQNYLFDYLIISNADIIIQKFPDYTLKEYNDCIIAPSIRNLKNRPQNPLSAYNSKKLEVLRHKGFKKNSNIIQRLVVYCYSFNKLIFYILYHLKLSSKIFAAHGAFVIFPENVLKKLTPLYNEDIFLFCEEGDLAMKARREGIITKYVSEIKILHKEDGSVSTISDKAKEILKDSYITFYNRWYPNK